MQEFNTHPVLNHLMNYAERFNLLIIPSNDLPYALYNVIEYLYLCITPHIRTYVYSYINSSHSLTRDNKSIENSSTLILLPVTPASIASPFSAKRKTAHRSAISVASPAYYKRPSVGLIGLEGFLDRRSRLSIGQCDFRAREDTFIPTY